MLLNQNEADCPICRSGYWHEGWREPCSPACSAHERRFLDSFGLETIPWGGPIDIDVLKQGVKEAVEAIGRAYGDIGIDLDAPEYAPASPGA